MRVALSVVLFIASISAYSQQHITINQIDTNVTPNIIYINYPLNGTIQNISCIVDMREMELMSSDFKDFIYACNNDSTFRCIINPSDSNDDIVCMSSRIEFSYYVIILLLFIEMYAGMYVILSLLYLYWVPHEPYFKKTMAFFCAFAFCMCLIIAELFPYTSKLYLAVIFFWFAFTPIIFFHILQFIGQIVYGSLYHNPKKNTPFYKLKEETKDVAHPV